MLKGWVRRYNSILLEGSTQKRARLAQIKYDQGKVVDLA